jgi:hypothetical protein
VNFLASEYSGLFRSSTHTSFYSLKHPTLKSSYLSTCRDIRYQPHKSTPLILPHHPNTTLSLFKSQTQVNMCFRILPRFLCNHPAGPERDSPCCTVAPGYIHTSKILWPELHDGICKNCQEDLKADSEMKKRKERKDRTEVETRSVRFT